MKRTLTLEQVISLLKTRQGKRTAKDFAAELGISAAYLSEVYRGTRNPGDAILSKFNLQERTVYEQVA